MGDACIRLIQALRMHYPDMLIMVNRGYALLPRIAGDIQMVLGESVYADYDFENRTYGRVNEDLYRQQVAWLQDARSRNPELAIYTLDYAEPDDRDAIAEIYRVQRSNGFIPYVATVELDVLVEEP